MLETGMFLVDRYEIISKVGAGGMSDVYKAKDHILGRVVAIKVLKLEYSEDINFVTKFRTEAQSAAGLEHPNIVNIYDVGSENGLHFIVMEYVEGITLKTYIEKKGQLSFKEATSIAIQVARGIEAAHNKDITHRDIKPQNIIISTEGKVKVTDFGIAKAISSNTISSDAMGSVHYASPEQARNGFIDGRSDIYSLGIVMYEMVTGRVPFDGDTTVAVAIQHLQEEMVEPSAFAPDLPISYEKIVLKTTQKSPDRRYQTIAELLADLRKALVTPDEDFVVISPIVSGNTRVISGVEMEEIQNLSADTDLEKGNGFTVIPEEEEVEEDEEDATGFLDPKMEKVVTFVGFGILGLIVIIVLYLIISILGGFKFGNNGNSQVSQNSQSQHTESQDTGSQDTEDSQVEDVEMIKIVGLSLTEATTKLENLGLVISVTGNEESDKEPNTVLTQEIAEGTKVAPGTIIKVTIAGESTKIPVPNVVGIVFSDAETQLKDAGFTVLREYQTSDTVAKDVVISQTPADGEDAEKGTSVTIVISEGVQKVKVPELKGKTLEEAKKALEDLGLTVKVVEEKNMDYPTKGMVIKVSDVGNMVAVGTEITLTVSIEIQMVTVPVDLVGLSSLAASDAFEALGLEIRFQSQADEAPTGTVLKVEKAGQQVPVGTVITVFVSEQIQQETESESESESNTDPTDPGANTGEETTPGSDQGQ